MTFKEFELIKKVREKFQIEDPLLVKGIGDDTAIFTSDFSTDFLITSDLMTEDVHFSLEYFEPEDIGWRILAANLSDIAAMGGKPLFFTISIAIPPHLKEGDFLDRFLDGLHACSSRYSVKLIGGDTSSSVDKLFIDITMIGSCENGQAVQRSGAEPGDLIYLLGKPGRSEAGLQLFLDGWRIEHGRAKNPDKTHVAMMKELGVLKCLYSHLRPQPLVYEGSILGRSGLLTSMIDTSDGLSSDLYHILEESNVGAFLESEIFENPLYEIMSPDLDAADPLEYILHGGEDFLLLFTIRPDKKTELEKLLKESQIYEFRQIGIITDRKLEMRYVDHEGSSRLLAPGGWEHS